MPATEWRCGADKAMSAAKYRTHFSSAPPFMGLHRMPDFKSQPCYYTLQHNRKYARGLAPRNLTPRRNLCLHCQRSKRLEASAGLCNSTHIV